MPPQKKDPILPHVLQALDTMEQEVTAFEANVLETVLRQKTWASWKQRQILGQMIERYLQDDQLASQIRGQLVLPGVS